MTCEIVTLFSLIDRSRWRPQVVRSQRCLCHCLDDADLADLRTKFARGGEGSWTYQSPHVYGRILAFDQFRSAREPGLPEHRISLADRDGCGTKSLPGWKLAAGFAERQQVVAAGRRKRSCRRLQRHEPD